MQPPWPAPTNASVTSRSMLSRAAPAQVTNAQSNTQVTGYQENLSVGELECGPIWLDLSPYSEQGHKLHWWAGLRCHPSSLAPPD